jgi:protein TonB
LEWWVATTVVKVFDDAMRHLFLLFAISVSALLAQTNSGQVGGGGSSQPPPGFQPPRVIQRSEPEYTKEALEAQYEGFVMLSAMIGVDGIPSEIKVVRGLGLGLNEKAVECLQTWRFSPAVRNGEPTPVKATVEIRFKLSSSN